MNAIPRHKVFVSFHHDDQCCKDTFVHMMEGNIVDKSVDDGDIDDDGLPVETIRQKIRDEFIRDATVTVVLIGPCTWQRKHVDWEIGSSLRDTSLNPRCGLLGILLPNHPDYAPNHSDCETTRYTRGRIPPRLFDNCGGDDPFARLYNWTNRPNTVRNWIHRAFERRCKTPPINNREQFGHNRSGNYLVGWKP